MTNEILTIEFSAYATEYLTSYASKTGLELVEHNNDWNDESGEVRAWVRNKYQGTSKQFAELAWYLNEERKRRNLDSGYKRSLTITLKKLPPPIEPTRPTH